MYVEFFDNISASQQFWHSKFTSDFQVLYIYNSFQKCPWSTMIQDPQLKLSHLPQAPVETHELAATAAQAPFHFLTRSLVATYTAQPIHIYMYIYSNLNINWMPRLVIFCFYLFFRCFHGVLSGTAGCQCFQSFFIVFPCFSNVFVHWYQCFQFMSIFPVNIYT